VGLHFANSSPLDLFTIAWHQRYEIIFVSAWQSDWRHRSNGRIAPIATTTGGVASVSTTNVSGETAPIDPVLQAQDGTFVGTVGTTAGENMIAFDGRGNAIWSVPNDYPQIATADGGVIGASGITYDNEGRADGQGALPGTPSWQGFMYSITGDPVVDRTVPPTLFLNANLLNAAGGNIASTGTTLSLPDDPWSLRFVPTYDSGSQVFPGNGAQREITYQLTKLDGTSRPIGQWYVTEHQTNFLVAAPNGMSPGSSPNKFIDTLSCNVLSKPASCGPTNQTFTISPVEGVCGVKSFGQVENTPCTSNGAGTIVVHTVVGDYGTLAIFLSTGGIKVNNMYKWPIAH
jgi:hypothetical protein